MIIPNSEVGPNATSTKLTQFDAVPSWCLRNYLSVQYILVAEIWFRVNLFAKLATS